MKDGTAAADLTNAYTQDKGSLKVKKTFADKTLTDKEKAAITFTVTGPDGFTTQKKAYSEFKDGVWDLGEVVPGDYTVTESNAEKGGYALTTTYKVDGKSAQVASATLAKGATATIELINAYKKSNSNTNTNNTRGSSSAAPRTGDETPIAPVAGFVAAAAVAIACLQRAKRRLRRQ